MTYNSNAINKTQPRTMGERRGSVKANCIYCARYSKCIREKIGCKNEKEAEKKAFCQNVVFIKTANGGRFVADVERR